MLRFHKKKKKLNTFHSSNDGIEPYFVRESLCELLSSEWNQSLSTHS